MKTSKYPKESARTSALLTSLRKTWGEHLFIFKIHGSPFQPRVVDLFGSFFGAAFAIEVKRPDNSPTPRQLKTLADVAKSGAFQTVLWSRNEAENFFENILDTLKSIRYSGDTSPTNRVGRERKRVTQMPAVKSKSAKAGKAATKAAPKSRKSAPVIEDDDLDDLEDLDDLDDFAADDDDEDEDDEEDEDEDEDEDEEDEPEPVKTRTSKRAANDATKAKAKAATKPSPVVTKKAAATKTPAKKGNASNLTPRRIAEGFVGAQFIADELGTDAKRVRVLFRKLNVPKNADGTYAWKTGSRDLKKVMGDIKKELA